MMAHKVSRPPHFFSIFRVLEQFSSVRVVSRTLSQLTSQVLAPAYIALILRTFSSLKCAPLRLTLLVASKVRDELKVASNELLQLGEGGLGVDFNNLMGTLAIILLRAADGNADGKLILNFLEFLGRGDGNALGSSVMRGGDSNPRLSGWRVVNGFGSRVLGGSGLNGLLLV